MALICAILSSTLISFISIVGLYWIFEKVSKKTLKILIGLSAGTMLGGAFLHLLPEAGENLNLKALFGWILVSFFVFFSLETWLHWRHCHNKNCKNHSFAYMNLLGDGLHNFIDGLIIGVAFFNSIGLGVSTSLAVLLHEIPQEMGDLGVLIYSGIKKEKAFKLNLLVSFLSVIGVIIGYRISNIGQLESYLLAMAGGGFLYIGGSDLIPEIRKKKKCWLCLITVMAGIGIMESI